MVAYSKWSANSPNLKKVRDAGFRCIQADTGENNADIMMCLDAYEEVRDRLEKGESGTVYVCFHGDKGFTHLLEKIKALQGWKSVWVTSNTRTVKMIENSASERLLITRVQPAKKQPAKKQPAKKQPAKKQAAKKQPAKQQPAKQQPVKKQPEPKQPAKKQSEPKQPVTIHSAKEAKPNWLEKKDYELLKSEIISVATEPMSIGQLGSRLTLSLKEKYGKGMTAKKFTHERGIPKSWSLAKIFRRYLAGDYSIEEKQSNPLVSPLNPVKAVREKSNILTSEKVGLTQEPDNLMRIPGFSKAGRGGSEFSIRMPFDPEKVQGLLQFIEQNRNTCMTWTELKKLVLESQIDSKSRTEPVYRFYRRSLDQMGRDIDWTQIGTPIKMAGLIEECILELYTQKEGLQKFNTAEIRTAIGTYFTSVKQNM